MKINIALGYFAFNVDYKMFRMLWILNIIKSMMMKQFLPLPTIEHTSYVFVITKKPFWSYQFDFEAYTSLLRQYLQVIGKTIKIQNSILLLMLNFLLL